MINTKLQLIAKSNLSKIHKESLFEDSRITEDTANRANLLSVDEVAAKDLGLSGHKGIAFPYPNLDGKIVGWRNRLDRPINSSDGRQQRYDQKPGSTLPFYFLNDQIELLKRISTPLIIVEGEKKLLCLASIRELDEYALLAYPGCWNFREKRGKNLAHPMDQIPLKGRKIQWVPDTNYFTNENVRMAGARFRKQLLKAGASVELIDLRTAYSPQNCPVEVKPDDLVAELGQEALIQCLNRSRLELNNNQVQVSSQDVTAIDLDATIPHDEILSELAEILLKKETFYRRGADLINFKENSYETINASDFPNKLANFGIRFFTDHDDIRKYKFLSENHSKTFFAGTYALYRLKAIDLLTKVPSYDKEWNLFNPGYNGQEKAYYLGPKIVPTKSLNRIMEISNGILFKDEASRANFIAMLLTAMLRGKHLGEKPLFAITGNRPNIGKSYALKLLSIIVEGIPPRAISYHANQEEFEKQIAAVIRYHDILSIDNVKTKLVDSQVLERLITDPIINFRILGLSEMITRPNTAVIGITMNNANFSRDLITRSLPIELYLDESINPSTYKFSNDDILRYALENRFEILEELCGMIESWKEQGRPLCCSPFRFKKWAQEIGGILIANGFIDFLKNYEEAATNYEPDSKEIGELFSGILSQYMSSKDLIKVCDEMDLFTEIRKAQKRPPAALTPILQKYVGKTIRLPDGNSFLLTEKWDKSRKIFTFRGEPVSQVSPGTTETAEDSEQVDTRDITIGSYRDKEPCPGTTETRTEPEEKQEEDLESCRVPAPQPKPCVVPGLPGDTDNHSSTKKEPNRGTHPQNQAREPDTQVGSPESQNPNSLEWN